MSLRFLTAGESHGPALVTILDGMPAGLSLDESIIDRDILTCVVQGLVFAHPGENVK